MIETTLRLQGFREVLDEAGVVLPDRRIVFTDYTPQMARAAVETLLGQDDAIDAIFLCSDYMAVTALEVLQRHGKAVPAEVALVGYDDVPLAQHATPKLTTVRQEIYEGGKRMARKLVDVLAGGSPSAEMLPVALIARGSTPPVSSS
jgi:LacI family transcriptional regulator